MSFSAAKENLTVTDVFRIDYLLITVTVLMNLLWKGNTMFSRFPMRARVSSASISDHSFVFIVCSDPNPFEIHTVFDGESPMVQADSH